MGSTAVGKVKVGVRLQAYGMEILLWKKTDECVWGATLREGDNVVHCHFEEDNLALAKLNILGQARNRVIARSPDADLPGCDTFLDSWKVVKLSEL